jgi:hypothetical protein
MAVLSVATCQFAVSAEISANLRQVQRQLGVPAEALTRRGGPGRGQGGCGQAGFQAGSRPDRPSSRSSGGASSGTLTRGANALPSPW